MRVCMAACGRQPHSLSSLRGCPRPLECLFCMGKVTAGWAHYQGVLAGTNHDHDQRTDVTNLIYCQLLAGVVMTTYQPGARHVHFAASKNQWSVRLAIIRRGGMWAGRRTLMREHRPPPINNQSIKGTACSSWSSIPGDMR